MQTHLPVHLGSKEEKTNALADLGPSAASAWRRKRRLAGGVLTRNFFALCISNLLGGELPRNRKWVIAPVINGISRVNPLITGLITHLRAVG